MRLVMNQPRPQALPKNRKKGLVTLAKFRMCCVSSLHLAQRNHVCPLPITKFLTHESSRLVLRPFNKASRLFYKPHLFRNSCFTGLSVVTLQQELFICSSFVPRPPPFLPSICVQNNRREWKTSEKWGRPGSIHHVNDIRWTRGGHGGEGIQLPKQCTGSSI